MGSNITSEKQKLHKMQEKKTQKACSPILKADSYVQSKLMII